MIMKPKVFVTRHLPDAAYKELHESCQVEIWDHEHPPTYQTILEKVADKSGLLCLLTDRIDTGLMDEAPGLRVISQCAVGYDNIDIQAARERGIKVGNTPDVLTNATADFTFTLMLSAARRVGEAIDHARDGKWQTWGLTTLLGQDVFGKTLGIIGMGRIGKAVAQRAKGFSMRVLYYDRNTHPEGIEGAVFTPIDEIFRESDFISLHVDLNEETRKLINADILNRMKPNCVLVNTSRGQVVDQDALYDALLENKIFAAAIDVTDPEPLPSSHKLYSLPNLLIAPHIASATVESRTQMALMAVRNLAAGVHGEPLPFPVV